MRKSYGIQKEIKKEKREYEEEKMRSSWFGVIFGVKGSSICRGREVRVWVGRSSGRNDLHHPCLRTYCNVYKPPHVESF